MEGEQPYLGDLLTMVLDHLLNGMILQVVPFVVNNLTWFPTNTKPAPFGHGFFSVTPHLRMRLPFQLIPWQVEKSVRSKWCHIEPRKKKDPAMS